MTEQQTRTNLLASAEQALGYKHPERGYLQKNAFTEALRVMGLAYFTPESVAKYKAKKAKQEGPGFFLRQLLKISDQAQAVLLVAGTLVGFIGVLVTLALVSEHANWIAISAVAGATAIALTPAALFASIAIGMILNIEFSIRTAQWKLIRLEKYKGAIPEFALATAVEIRQRVPNVILHIDELSVGRRPVDPFLVAEFEGTHYHLEVWDEPGYKQERVT